MSDVSLFKDANELVNEAKTYGNALAKSDLKAHQLRRIFETVQSIDEAVELTGTLSGKLQGRLKLLKPQLAYLASREEKLKGIQDRLSGLIDQVRGPEELKELYDFVQSVLAYHRSFGG